MTDRASHCQRSARRGYVRARMRAVSRGRALRSTELNGRSAGEEPSGAEPWRISCEGHADDGRHNGENNGGKAECEHDSEIKRRRLVKRKERSRRRGEEVKEPVEDEERLGGDGSLYSCRVL